MIRQSEGPRQAPPEEWWTRQGGHASTAQYRAWLKGETVGEKKRSKFGAKAGRCDFLNGIYLRSRLEANTGALLLFLGFQQWCDKSTTPPLEGKHFAYEWKKYRLDYKRGKEGERTLWYLPDWHVWDNGRLTLWESKGLLDARSKRLLTLMEKQHREIPVELITLEELDRRKAETLYKVRRAGQKTQDIPYWQI